MSHHRLLTTETVLLTAGLLALAYLLGDVLLLVFAAVLIAVGIDGLVRWLMERVPLSRPFALILVLLVIVGGIGTAIWLTAARLVRQFGEVADKVIEFAGKIHDWLVQTGVLAFVEDVGGGGDMVPTAAGRIAGQAFNLGIGALGATASLIILIFLTVFLVADPALYRRGLVRLVPPDRRGVTQETLSAIAHGLRWWFLGQLVSMALLGVTVGLGLFLLGIELWLALAVLTAVLTFVPFLGSLIATVPIVAVGFAAGVQTGVIVLIGYIVIQNIEGNIIVPMIHQKAVDLAPAVLIAMQVLFSLVFGVAGLILAAPLTIMVMIAVQKLWVEHVLGDRTG
jgi:predicted PurR-regulated permease PerM